MPSTRAARENVASVVPEKVAQGRAIAYQRVSTQGQAADEKSGFARQQDAFDRWCADHPEHPPLQAYRIARSGADAGRFQWLHDGLQRGDFLAGDVLVVESLNRFGREAPILKKGDGKAAANQVKTANTESNNLAGKKREELQEMRDNLDAMLKDHPDTME